MLSKISMEIINSLSISELEVLYYIDGNLEEAQKLSIQGLAKKMFVSTSTIMRLCKKLGFSGYSELKFFLRDEISKRESYERSITFDSMIQQQVGMIGKTADLLNEKNIMDLVGAMKNSKNIHFFGKGLTALVLKYASKLLLTRGVMNCFYEDTHIAYLAARKMDESDIVFLASLSGNTHQIVRMAQECKSRGAKVVGITSGLSNELSKLADYPLVFSGDTYVVKPDDISSRLPILFILNIIINLYFTSNK